MAFEQASSLTKLLIYPTEAWPGPKNVREGVRCCKRYVNWFIVDPTTAVPSIQYQTGLSSAGAHIQPLDLVRVDCPKEEDPCRSRDIYSRLQQRITSSMPRARERILRALAAGVDRVMLAARV